MVRTIDRDQVTPSLPQAQRIQKVSERCVQREYYFRQYDRAEKRKGRPPLPYPNRKAAGIRQRLCVWGFLCFAAQILHVQYYPKITHHYKLMALLYH